MKNKAMLVLILLLVAVQSGCKISFFGRTEISQIEFIRAIGIDKSSEKDGDVRLTIATQRIQGDGAGAGQRKQSKIIVSEGETVFEAVRNYWNSMDKRPFWGHLEYALIGEEAAKEGLLKYLDFFCRDPEVRLNIKVFLTKGSSAERVMNQGGDESRFIFEQLQGITENQYGQSIINVVDLVEVMYIFDREHLCLYLPCLELQQKTNSDVQGDAMDIVMGGFALFESDKLTANLDMEMSRGLNWLRNKVKSGIIPVKSPQGHKVSLEIIESNVKLKPDLLNGKLTIHVNASVFSNIGGIQTNEDIFTEEAITFLEKQQEIAVREEIEEVIRFGQERDMDFFSTGDAVFKKYPIQWEDEFEEKWKTCFSEVVFDVQVASVITVTYNIIQPSREEKGEKP
ncbi:MAG: Ger(x)C family spore germination protein [Ruminiclostridium sp.]|nr:Ger(x)C family spore germination protein [Ruminiclostridium sp.]